MADFGQNAVSYTHLDVYKRQMQVSVHAVDVGCAQLAMHSCVETAGARDVELAIEALAAFYGADIRIDGAEGVELA